MRKLVRKIRMDVYPLFKGDAVGLIEVVAGLISSGKKLPVTLGKTEGHNKSRIVQLLTEIADWTGMDPVILGYLYESLQEKGVTRSKQSRRRKRGIFYTPGYITEFLVKAAIDACRIANNGNPPAILDPACGSGAFLIAAFRELCVRYPDRKPRELATRYIHGIDSDSKAVHVATISLWLEADLNNRDWRKLENNIREGDSLREFIRDGHKKIEVVVGNPPYRNVKRGISKKTRKFCSAHYKSASGQWDLAAPFVELTLEHLLEPCGACGLILPNPILLAENYKIVRKIILRNDLVAFGPAGRAFSDPGVEASLLIVRAGKPVRYRKKSATILDAVNGKLINEKRTIPWKLIHRLPFKVFSHLADPSFLDRILDRFDSGDLVRLGDHVKLTRGLEIGKRDGKVIAGSAKRAKNTRPLIAGESVTQFHAVPEHAFRLPGRNVLTDFKDPELWSGDRQLLLRRVASTPIAAVASPPALVLNTVYVIRAREGYYLNEYASCALLNSPMFREIFRQMFAFDDSLFPYLRISQINKVPVPLAALADSHLAARSLELHERGIGQKKSPSGESAAVLLEGIDKRVMELYDL